MQASAIRDLSSADSRNWPYTLGGPATNTIPVGTRLDTHWIDIDNMYHFYPYIESFFHYPDLDKLVLYLDLVFIYKQEIIQLLN